MEKSFGKGQIIKIMEGSFGLWDGKEKIGSIKIEDVTAIVYGKQDKKPAGRKIVDTAIEIAFGMFFADGERSGLLFKLDNSSGIYASTEFLCETTLTEKELEELNKIIAKQ